ncbi:hypothetical protein M0R04_10245 [Candidatus Dojkabacteria bacterium]|nr:hypothetical protein [Candidatus Dojkabacteria bacterium]
MDISSKMSTDYKSLGFNSDLSRVSPKSNVADYIGGANFDVLLDDLLFNRMIKLKDLRQQPQGNDAGKIYWDGENNLFKLWVNDTIGWVNVQYTSTSTSSTSSSSSSTSTTSTSSSTSSTSSSSSSTSTSTTI